VGVLEGGQIRSSPGAPSFRTKASHRDSKQVSATHSPVQRGEFMLPPLSIEGLSLSEALNKVFAAIQEACLISEETPLALRFDLPTQASRPLKLHLRSRSFTTSVSLLASLAGMSVTRNSLKYRFEPLPAGSRSGMEVVQLPSGSREDLDEMSGVNGDHDPFANKPTASGKTITESLAVIGLELDPAARVSLEASGETTLEGARPAEAAAIQSLAEPSAS
jgi:hypothetical protein